VAFAPHLFDEDGDLHFARPDTAKTFGIGVCAMRRATLVRSP
jgi:hypothetical protein